MTPERDIQRLEAKVDDLIATLGGIQQDVAMLKASDARRTQSEMRQPTLTLSIIMAVVALTSVLVNVYPLLIDGRP